MTTTKLIILNLASIIVWVAAAATLFNPDWKLFQIDVIFSCIVATSFLSLWLLYRAFMKKRSATSKESLKLVYDFFFVGLLGGLMISIYLATVVTIYSSMEGGMWSPKFKREIIVSGKTFYLFEQEWWLKENKCTHTLNKNVIYIDHDYLPTMKKVAEFEFYADEMQLENGVLTVKGLDGCRKEKMMSLEAPLP